MKLMSVVVTRFVIGENLVIFDANNGQVDIWQQSVGASWLV